MTHYITIKDGKVYPEDPNSGRSPESSNTPPENVSHGRPVIGSEESQGTATGSNTPRIASRRATVGISSQATYASRSIPGSAYTPGRRSHNFLGHYRTSGASGFGAMRGTGNGFHGRGRGFSTNRSGHSSGRFSPFGFTESSNFSQTYRAGSATNSRLIGHETRHGNKGKRFLKKVVEVGANALKTREDRRRFLQTITEYSDGVELLFRLSCDNGNRALNMALASESSPEFFKSCVLPFISRLGKNDACLSLCKTSLIQILHLIQCVPSMISLMLNVVQEEKLTEADLITLSWFILKLVCRGGQTDVPCNDDIGKLAAALIEQGSLVATRELRVVFSASRSLERETKRGALAIDDGNDNLAIEDLIFCGPGGRHDNDHDDFRRIRLLPTPDEVNSGQEPYLPPKEQAEVDYDNPSEDQINFESDIAGRTRALLDRQFRLLREDFVGPIRATIQKAVISEDVQFKDRYGTVVYTDLTFDSIRARPRPCIAIQLRLPKWHRVYRVQQGKKRRAFWASKLAESTLPYGSLVGLVVNGKLTNFGTIVRREVDELCLSDDKGPSPIVGITFSGPDFHQGRDQGSATLFTYICDRFQMPSLALIQASSSVFAYRPFLKCLQEMATIPFAEELLMRMKSDTPNYLEKVDILEEIDRLETRDGFKYDDSQKRSMSLALSNRVSLIHGGPGTGKSFIGVRIADVIYRKTSERILCLCFTNHALDCFLKDLHDAGIRRIARLGSKCTIDELEQYKVRNLSHAFQNNEQSFRRRWASIKSDMDMLEGDLSSISMELQKLSINKGSWYTVKPMLDGEIRSQLEVSQFKEITEAGFDKKGFALVGEKGKVVHEDYLWRRWIAGKNAGKLDNKFAIHEHTSSQGSRHLDIWKMSKSERLTMADSYIEKLSEDARETAAEIFERFERAHNALGDLKRDSTRRVLAASRVIGCTTTGAAGVREILESVQPTVVIVEEAGEVLEAQVLACLNNSTKHLILIGDHLQLRPKVSNHALSVFSGKGHDLNESLFERLAKRGSGLQVGELHVQHRMKSQIAEFIRPTYPLMEHGLGTKNRGSLCGVSDDVIFMDHDHAEDENAFENMFEVDLVVSITKYLCQNGTSPGDICVLTPYVAQLIELRRALSASSEWNIFVSNRDLDDIANSDVPENRKAIATKLSLTSPNDNGTRTRNAIRVATVDNFQGEEADVIIASLVRCNAERRIGFLSDGGRVNVLLSRARNAEIIIGSVQTLRNAKNPEGKRLWGRILDDLQSGGHIRRSFPIHCKNHGTAPTQAVVSAQDFARVKDGGCDAPCIGRLPCGHICRLSCHPYDDQHLNMTCTTEVEDVCPQGHTCLRECGKQLFCNTCQELAFAEKEKDALQKELSTLQVNQEIQTSRRLAELKDEAKLVRNRIKHVEKEIDGHLRTCQADIERERLHRELELKEKHKAANVTLRLAKARRQAEEELQAKEEKAAADLRMELKAEKMKLKALEAKKSHCGSKLSRLQSTAKLELYSLDLPNERALSHSSDGFIDGLDVAEATAIWSGFQESIESGDPSGLLNRLQNADSTKLRSLLNTLLEAPKTVEDVLTNLNHPRTSIDELPKSVARFRRGISLLQKRELLQAYDFFHSSVSQTETPGLASLYEAFLKVWLGGEEERVQLEEGWEKYFSADVYAVPVMAALNSFRSQREEHSTEREQKLQRVRIGDALLALTHPFSLSMGISLAAFENLRAVSSFVPVLLSPKDSVEAQCCNLNSVPEKEMEKRAGDSKALRKLCQLTGLHEVKMQMLQLRDLVTLNKERGVDIRKHQYNTLFTGNPGTGKTTVARLYAILLEELHVIPSNVMVETSGAKLGVGGTSELQDHLDNLKNGGVLFVDEAYQLVTSGGAMGGQVLDLLLTEMEDRRGELVVIFAGYKKDMEKLCEHNAGIPSRIGQAFDFADFTDEELESIMRSQLKSHEPQYAVTEEKYIRIAARRLGGKRGRYGFGNARAVRNFMEATRARQAARILRERRSGQHPNSLELVRDDFLGPKNLQLETSPGLQSLNAMTGLRDVKNSVRQLLRLIETNSEREEKELPLQHVSLNRLFIGSPGTGKTTVAKIYGQILYELGLLSKGEVILKNPSDFVGSALGQSEQNTKGILDSALGSVLVIDEAYSLHAGEGTSNPYLSSVIDTIVAMVQGVPGEDRCVLMLGYEDQMTEFLREANPGLSRRFQLENAFRFHDFNDSELLAILRNKALKSGWILPFDVAREGVRQLAKQRSKPNFGNGGAVDNLLSQAVQKFEDRMKAKCASERADNRTLAAGDFSSAEDTAAVRIQTNPEELFEDLVGCSEIISMMRAYVATVEQAQAMGRDPKCDMELNLLFVGPPGTGKTTVAKRMGLLFQSLGLLPRSDVTQCSASDFSTGFVGQAGKQTRKIFESALGGVLLIDEAYRLKERTGHGYMAEATDEIVNMLTEEKFIGNIVVIFAGYENEIDDMIASVNPGLRSRVTRKVRFSPLKARDASVLLISKIDTDGFQLEAEAERTLPDLMKKLAEAEDWSSGRDVDTWCKRIRQECALHKCQEVAGKTQVTATVLRKSWQEYIDTKVSKTNPLQEHTQSEEGSANYSFAFNPNSAASQVPIHIQTTQKTQMDIKKKSAAKRQTCSGEDIVAALQKACVDLGYDKDHDSRKCLVSLLEKTDKGGDFPAEILEAVRNSLPAGTSDERIIDVLRPQVPSVLRSFSSAVAEEESRCIELARMEREERERAIAREAEIKAKVRAIGKCPVGFDWHREGSGWRCNGGSHFVSGDLV